MSAPYSLIGLILNRGLYFKLIIAIITGLGRGRGDAAQILLVTAVSSILEDMKVREKVEQAMPHTKLTATPTAQN